MASGRTKREDYDLLCLLALSDDEKLWRHAGYVVSLREPTSAAFAALFAQSCMGADLVNQVFRTRA